MARSMKLRFYKPRHEAISDFPVYRPQGVVLKRSQRSPDFYDSLYDVYIDGTLIFQSVSVQIAYLRGEEGSDGDTSRVTFVLRTKSFWYRDRVRMGI